MLHARPTCEDLLAQVTRWRPGMPSQKNQYGHLEFLGPQIVCLLFG